MALVIGEQLVWRLYHAWRQGFFSCPVFWIRRCVYVECRVRVNSLGHIIGIVASDSALSVIAQVHFGLCSFRLGQLGKRLMGLRRRSDSHRGSTFHTSHCDSVLKETNGSFNTLRRDVLLKWCIWLIQGSERLQSILLAPPELVQGLRTFPLIEFFERALPSSPFKTTMDSFLLLSGMEFTFYNDLITWLNLELYSPHILKGSCIPNENDFEPFLDPSNTLLRIPRC